MSQKPKGQLIIILSGRQAMPPEPEKAEAGRDD